MSKNFKYLVQIDGETKQFEQSVDNAKSKLDQLFKTNKSGDLSAVFDNITKKIDKLRERANSPIDSESQFDLMRKSVSSTAWQLGELKKILDDISNASTQQKMELIPKGEASKISQISKSFDTLMESIAKSKKETEALTNARNRLKQANKKVEQKELDVRTTTANRDSAQTRLNEATQKRDQLKAQQAAALAASEQYARIQQAYKDNSGYDKRKPIEDPLTGQKMNLQTARRRAQENVDPSKELADAEADYNALKASVDKYNASLEKLNKTLVENKTAQQLAQKDVTNLESTFNTSQATAVQNAIKTTKQEAQKLGVDLSKLDSIDFSDSSKAADELSKIIQSLINDAFIPLKESAEQASAALPQVADDLDKVNEKINQEQEVWQIANEKAAQIQGITDRIQAYLTLNGVLEITKRMLREAFAATKELDDQMTEMAVVTSESVGGYWDQLPEYTRRANELGVSIKSAYEAATLYYQQGLKTNEVTAVSNATLKMARIAGLSASESTDKMTAALRGFNMEVNEVNADNIADVYSKLAAITASNVNEISSAMTKTASLASSAGMTFETTAAFLAQAIETTRESAENIGTALIIRA